MMEESKTGEAGKAAQEISEDIKSLVSKTANAAQSAHASRMAKVFDKKLAEMQNSFESKFSEFIELAKGVPEQSKSVQDTDEKTAKYEARLKELEDKLASEKQAAEQEKLASRRKEERFQLTEALRTAGASEDRIRGAVALLYSEDSRVGRNETGDIIFRVPKEGYVDEVPLIEGVKGWIDSPEGLHYKPALEVSGSGSRGGDPMSSGSSSDRNKASLELRQAVLTALAE